MKGSAIWKTYKYEIKIQLHELLCAHLYLKYFSKGVVDLYDQKKKGYLPA